MKNMKKMFDFFQKELTRIIAGLVFFASAFIMEKLGAEYPALALYIVSLLTAGFPVFFDAVRGILRRDFLDEKFLMSIASIGAMIVGEWSEGCAVMLFFLVGEFFEHKAVAKSRKSIKELMDICPDTANVLIDGEEVETDAEDVGAGSLIVIRSGERVPIDAIIVEGGSDIDTSALTGESLPRAVSVGDEIQSGAVIINGVVTARTQRAAEESAAARILSLVENANERKAKEENFITKFSRVYTPIVVSLAVFLAIIPSLFGLTEWSDSIYRALIFLVISCPCALVISVPMAFFGGIGCAASRGILFKGGNVFAPLAKAETFAFDKTGTLTTADFAVTRVDEIGKNREEILFLAACAEYSSNHPVSLAIKALVPGREKPDFSEELPGRGVRSILSGNEILVGNRKLMSEFSVECAEEFEDGIYVSLDSKLVGIIYISDKVKEEARSSLSDLRKAGAKTLVMLSGDKREKAELVAEELLIDKVYTDLLPDEKYDKLEELISENKSGVVYVGDGINDAPSLAGADVGVAMGAIGQDIAISAADLVLMSDNLDRLPEAVLIARKTLMIAKENIIFALGVKFAVLLLGAMGFANMWLAVFADVGVAVLAILNSMRTLLKRKNLRIKR